MKVEDINIEDDYIIVKNTDTVLNVAKELAKAGIPDAIVVDGEDRTIGALDDYDIISKAVAPEKDLTTLTAEDIMYGPPPVHLTTELSFVKQIMEELEASVIPVVDDDKKLLGVITIMDVYEAEAMSKRSILDRLLGR